MVSKSLSFQLGSLSGFRFALPLRIPLTMGDSDAALKRRLAAMEEALGEVQAALAEAQGEIAELQGRNDGALAAMAAAVTAQASATQAQDGARAHLPFGSATRSHFGAARSTHQVTATTGYFGSTRSGIPYGCKILARCQDFVHSKFLLRERRVAANSLVCLTRLCFTP